MANTLLNLTNAQLTALVAKEYPNLVVTGVSSVRTDFYSRPVSIAFEARARLDPSNPVWTSSDGRQTPVSEMALTHVENALAKVIRNDYGYDQDERRFWINAFSTRLASAGN